MNIPKKVAEYLVRHNALKPGFTIMCKGWAEDQDYQEITEDYLEEGHFPDGYTDFMISEG